jgi:hypothetical protein
MAPAVDTQHCSPSSITYVSTVSKYEALIKTVFDLCYICMYALYVFSAHDKKKLSLCSSKGLDIRAAIVFFSSCINVNNKSKKQIYLFYKKQNQT